MPSLVIGQIDKGSGHPKFGEVILKQQYGIAEHAPRTDHMIAGFEQTEADRRNRRHAGCHRDAALTAFQCRQPMLEGTNRGIGEARVNIAGFFPGKPGGSLGGTVEDIAGSSENRVAMFLLRGAPLSGAYGLGFRAKIVPIGFVHFFQRLQHLMVT